MNCENGFAGMIIEFDSIRTACELWKSSVRYARFRRYGHSVRRLLSSVVERVLRKDEVGSSILPEGIFFVSDRLRFCPIFMLRDVEPAMPHPTRPSASRNSTRLGRRARSRPGWSPYVFWRFIFCLASAAKIASLVTRPLRGSGRYCRGPRGVERHNHHAPSRLTASSDATRL